MFEFTLDRKFMDQIRSGRKCVEGRVNSPKYHSLEIGAQIKFVEEGAEENEILAEVEELHTYPGFFEYLCAEGMQNCLPGVDTFSEGVEIYRGFPGYREKEKEFGALAIKFRLL